MKLRTAQRHPYALFYENEERGCIFMRLKCLRDMDRKAGFAGYRGNRPAMLPVPQT